MFTIRGQTCPNPNCFYFEKETAGNISVHSRAQKRFRCSACGRTWGVCRNHFHFGLRSDFQKIDFARALLQQGRSIRVVAKTVKISPSTVQRWKTRLQYASV